MKSLREDSCDWFVGIDCRGPLRFAKPFGCATSAGIPPCATRLARQRPAPLMQLLPGFRDFYPEECARRNYILTKWREVARRYGFVEYDGPVLEPMALYEKKSGGELVGQMFTVGATADSSGMKVRPFARADSSLGDTTRNIVR